MHAEQLILHLQPPCMVLVARLVALTRLCDADTTSPVINCLTSVDVELGISESLVSSATDASGIPDVSCTSDTSTLGVGENQAVVCTALDRHGNAATCAVAVTVTGAHTRFLVCLD